MVIKKKTSMEEKAFRRVKEIEKAMAKSSDRVVTTTKSDTTTSETNFEKYKLPIADIKSDLVRNIAFALFSIGVLLFLKISGVIKF